VNTDDTGIVLHVTTIYRCIEPNPISPTPSLQDASIRDVRAGQVTGKFVIYLVIFGKLSVSE
jgi:hypothetical protein